jgi:benzoyl-CoA reductase/2-hydroxyglutaryl-CoA dehydratase subunit BcrC/BadD/HgdB
MPPIKATSAFKELMKAHYAELDGAAAGAEGTGGRRKVAWCTSMGQVELLRAFGLLTYFPENHGALLGSTRKSMDYIPVANCAGYSPEICSYLTSDVGAFLKGETPLKDAYGVDKVPRPDVLFYNTNQCRELVDWFQFYRRAFKVPLIGINTPRHIDVLTKEHVDAVVAQERALIGPLEKISGTAFDEKRLSSVVGLSRDASVLWKKALETARTRPAPLTFFDGVIHMGPIVVMRGLKGAVDYYGMLAAEMRGRVKDGVAAVQGERLRLFWDGMPVWGRLRMLSDLFTRHEASVVASTYCNTWALDRLDPARPFETMASEYTGLHINLNDDRKMEYFKRMAREFSVDGLIFHNARTCPATSNADFGLPTRFEEETGIPALVLDGDLCDLRCFSDDQARTAIEAFIEQLEGGGGGGGR